MESSRLQPARAPGSYLRSILLGLATAVLAGVAAEISLRAFGFERSMPARQRFANDLDRIAENERSAYRPDAEVFWDLKPGGRDLRAHDEINRLGMRGPEYALEKPASTCRIAVVGGSATYGWRLFYQQTYGARLEAWLRAEHPERQIEVVNAGVPGYSIYQGRLFFERKILPMHPDVAVFHFGGWNDLCAAIGWPDSQRNTATAERRLASRLGSLRLFQVVRSAVAALRGGDPDPKERLEAIERAWLDGEPLHGYRVPPEEFATILEDLIATCDREGIQAILIVPDLSRAGLEPGADPQKRRRTLRQLELLDRYRGILFDAAGRHGLATVDQRQVLESFPPERTFFLPDVEHVTAFGNLLIADALLKRVLAGGRVESVPPAPVPPDERSFLRLRPRVLGREDDLLHVVVEAGTENAGRSFLLLPSRTVAEVDFKRTEPRPLLVVDAVLDAVRAAGDAGSLEGELDAAGTARLEVRLPREAISAADGPFLGFVLLAAGSRSDLPAAPAWFSNDAWIRIGE